MLIQFTKPQNLNGGKLIQELTEAGIEINTDTSPMIDGNGDFWLDIDESKTEATAVIVAAHQG